MKRILVSVLVGMFLMVGICFAQNPTAVDEYSYEIENTTGVAKTTVIPITSIRPGVDKLSAYEIMRRNVGNSEAYIGVYDDTTLACTGERLGEKEAMAGASAGERFIKPKKIANGLVVIQGANTIAMIYFQRE